MALVPYRSGTRRNYGSAFGAPSYALAQRNTRPRYTQMMGMARYGSQLSQGRGSRYGRGGYQRYFSGSNLRTHPVYPKPEVKALDTQFGTLVNPNSIALSGTNTGNFTVINAITPGTLLNGRLGNQIATKSVYYQYVLNFGTGPVPNAIRHLLVWDKQPNGAAPALTDVLAANQGTANSDYITVPMNLTNRDRFVILADERTTLSPNGDQIRIITGFRKINQRSDFGVSGVSPTTGALCLAFVSDETVTANEPTVYGTWRVRFIDC